MHKRHIDGFNQSRNDAVAWIDDLTLQPLTDKLNRDAPLHAETASMMMDRLSIRVPKIKAMCVQTVRADVDAAHLGLCREKLGRLHEQRSDLAHCLDTLPLDYAAGQARYKFYRQFKMYNDSLWVCNFFKLAEQSRQAFKHHRVA